MKAAKYALVIVLCWLSMSAWAEWGRAPNEAIRAPAVGQTLCSDGQGGVWSGSLGWFCHIDRNGNPTWNAEPCLRGFQNLGRDTSSYPADQRTAVNGRLALVGINDYIWGISRNGPHPWEYIIGYRAWVQLVSIDGEQLWRRGGIPLDSAFEWSYVFGVYPGPTEGTFLVHWGKGFEWTEGSSEPMLQLVNSDGEFLWGDFGVRLDWDNSNSYFTKWEDDCFIVAQNVWPNPTIAVVKYDLEGEVVWEQRLPTFAEGVTLCSINDIESDRAGGAILTYSFLREVIIGGNPIQYVGVNVLRISGGGDSLWTRQVFERRRNGAEEFWRTEPIINYGGEGTYLIAWNDHGPNEMQTVALDLDGEFLWESPEVIVLSAGYQNHLAGVDSEGGICYVWADWEERERPSTQVWGQRISNEGERLWGDRGIPLIYDDGEALKAVTECNGGMIVANLRLLQMVNRDGEIGVVLPVGVGDDYSNDPALPGAFSVELYPNPVNSHFRIVFDAAVPNQTYSYSLFDGAGRSVDSGEILSVGSFEGDLSQLASGQYFLRLKSKKASVTKGFSLVR